MKRFILPILIVSTITGGMSTALLHGQSESRMAPSDRRGNPLIRRGSADQSNVTDVTNLRVVRELKSLLRNKPIVVVFGAPSSGKTEQMQLALGKDYGIFDLRSEFVKSVAKQREQATGVPLDKEAKEKLKKEEYSSLKKEEFEWLQKNRAAIFEKLAALPQKLIVFDEIDLWKGAPGTEEKQFELETAKSIIDLAKQLNNETGKKIILILHKEGLDSSELRAALESQLMLNVARDVVRTGHLSRLEETLLLNTTKLTPEQRRTYMLVAQGNPAAYVTLIANIADNNASKNSTYSFEDLLSIARKKIGVMYKIARQIDPNIVDNFEVIVRPLTAANLQNLAKNNAVIQDLGEQLDALIKHGIVGTRDGGYTISTLVKEVVDSRIQ